MFAKWKRKRHLKKLLCNKSKPEIEYKFLKYEDIETTQDLVNVLRAIDVFKGQHILVDESHYKAKDILYLLSDKE